MNALTRTPRPATRHKITRAQYHAMSAAAVFPADLDLELIDGDLIEMAGDGHRTIDWNWVLVRWLNRTLSDAYAVVPDKSLVISEHDEPKPDIWIFDAAHKTADVTGANVLLVIEVADTTLDTDLAKAAIYARGGVREYWVVDIESRSVLMHRLGGDGAYDPPIRVPETEHAAATLIPDLAFRISDFPRLRSA